MRELGRSRRHRRACDLCARWRSCAASCARCWARRLGGRGAVRLVGVPASCRAASAAGSTVRTSADPAAFAAAFLLALIVLSIIAGLIGGVVRTVGRWAAWIARWACCSASSGRAALLVFAYIAAGWVVPHRPLAGAGAARAQPALCPRRRGVGDRAAAAGRTGLGGPGAAAGAGGAGRGSAARDPAGPRHRATLIWPPG